MKTHVHIGTMLAVLFVATFVTFTAGCQSTSADDAIAQQAWQETAWPRLIAAVDWDGGYTFVPESVIEFAVWNTGDMVWWSQEEHRYCHVKLSKDEIKRIHDRVVQLPLNKLNNYMGWVAPDMACTSISLMKPDGRLGRYDMSSNLSASSIYEHASYGGSPDASLWLQARNELLAMCPKTGETVNLITPVQQIIENTFPGELNDYSEFEKSFEDRRREYQEHLKSQQTGKKDGVTSDTKNEVKQSNSDSGK